MTTNALPLSPLTMDEILARHREALQEAGRTAAAVARRNRVSRAQDHAELLARGDRVNLLIDAIRARLERGDRVNLLIDAIRARLP